MRERGKRGEMKEEWRRLEGKEGVMEGERTRTAERRGGDVQSGALKEEMWRRKARRGGGRRNRGRGTGAAGNGQAMSESQQRD